MDLLSFFLHAQSCGSCVTPRSIHHILLNLKLHVLATEWHRAIVSVRDIILFDWTEHQVLEVRHLSVIGKDGIAQVTVSFNGVNCENSCHF